MNLSSRINTYCLLLLRWNLEHEAEKVIALVTILRNKLHRQGLLEAFLGYHYLCVKDECSVWCICLMWVHVCVFMCVHMCVCMMCVNACVCVQVSCGRYGCQKINLGFISTSTFFDTAFHNPPYIMSNWSLSFCDPPAFHLHLWALGMQMNATTSSFVTVALTTEPFSPGAFSLFIYLAFFWIACSVWKGHCSWVYLVLNKLHIH